jgi:betaine-aldehyde dehydrogenase
MNSPQLSQTHTVRGSYVDGGWRQSAGGIRSISCPADGTHVADVAECTSADAEAAVASARKAFDDGRWPGTPELERGAILLRVAGLLQRDKADYAAAEALDTGKRLVEAEYDIDDVIACFRYYGSVAGTDAGRVIDTGRPGAISRVVHAPVGVCGLITPWNYPLLQASWKVAPALLAGNTFVLKPSELTPSTSILLMDTLREAGVPDGVANLVTGTGPEVGAVLSSDPRVDLVSFTGGLETGGSWWLRRRRSSAWPSSSAARTRMWSLPTLTGRPRSTTP